MDHPQKRLEATDKNLQDVIETNAKKILGDLAIRPAPEVLESNKVKKENVDHEANESSNGKTTDDYDCEVTYEFVDNSVKPTRHGGLQSWGLTQTEEGYVWADSSHPYDEEHYLQAVVKATRYVIVFFKHVLRVSESGGNRALENMEVFHGDDLGYFSNLAQDIEEEVIWREKEDNYEAPFWETETFTNLSFDRFGECFKFLLQQFEACITGDKFEEWANCIDPWIMHRLAGDAWAVADMIEARIYDDEDDYHLDSSDGEENEAHNDRDDDEHGDEEDEGKDDSPDDEDTDTEYGIADL